MSLYFCRGFSVSTVNRVHVFKPVSVQAMWWATSSRFSIMHSSLCICFTLNSCFTLVIHIFAFVVLTFVFPHSLSHMPILPPHFLILFSFSYFNILLIHPHFFCYIISPHSLCLLSLRIWGWKFGYLPICETRSKNLFLCDCQVGLAVTPQSLRGGSLP